jgi:hypothetical protein
MKNNRSVPASRRTATKVKDGRVQRKNRRTLSSHGRIELLRRAPGPGFRHVVSKNDIQKFIELIPGWDMFSQGLDRIVLCRGDDDADAFYCFWHREETGGIFLHAWPEDLWVTWSRNYFDYHPQIEVLGVVSEVQGDSVRCHFSEAQARAFMLLHVFMHELGHHWHALQRRHHSSKLDEVFAEKFANERFWDLYPGYVQVFGDPAKSGTK